MEKVYAGERKIKALRKRKDGGQDKVSEKQEEMECLAQPEGLALEGEKEEGGTAKGSGFLAEDLLSVEGLKQEWGAGALEILRNTNIFIHFLGLL